MNCIKVTERSDDFHACIDGKPGYWGCGKTPRDAIGNLVQAHPEQFNTEIDYEETKEA